MAPHQAEFFDLLPADQKAFLKPAIRAVADPTWSLVPSGKLDEELLRDDMTSVQREALWIRIQKYRTAFTEKGWRRRS